YLFSKPVSPKELEELFLLEKIRTKKSNTRPEVERRKYFRLKLPLPLLSEMTILSINKKDVSLGSTEVLVQDIGLGGLRFVSHLRLTANPGIIYGFKTRIMDKDLNLSGKVVRSEEISVGIFEYGIEFLIDERDRDALTRLLNQLTPKIKANPLFHEGNFITDDPMAYIRKRFIS
ncbi:MAG: PilZ domain-containing protein, partial [Tuberibacillus sp.]